MADEEKRKNINLDELAGEIRTKAVVDIQSFENELERTVQIFVEDCLLMIENGNCFVTRHDNFGIGYALDVGSGHICLTNNSLWTQVGDMFFKYGFLILQVQNSHIQPKITNKHSYDTILLIRPKGINKDDDNP